MEKENTLLLIYIWGIVGLRSGIRGGGIGARPPKGSLPFPFTRFFTIAFAFPGFMTLLSAFPALLGYDPFSIDTGKSTN